MSRPSSTGNASFQSHYSLRWNNHRLHMMKSIGTLLDDEEHVDVTLICDDVTIKAHRAILGASSPFFSKIFEEHHSDHPIILLKDFPTHEIEALVDFMYRGEVRIGQDDLAGLMRAAECLQIRGLALVKPQLASPSSTPGTFIDETGPSDPPIMVNNNGQIIDEEEEDIIPRSSPPIFRRRHHENNQPSSAMGSSSRETSRSPSSSIPRRKQARPRRRSSDLSTPQDLSRPHPTRSLSPPSMGLNLSNDAQRNSSLSLQSYLSQQNSPSTSYALPTDPHLQFPHHQRHHRHNHHHHHHHHHHHEEEAENLSMKKEPRRSSSPPPSDQQAVKSESEDANSPRASPMASAQANVRPDAPFSINMSALSMATNPSSEYLASLGQLAAQWLPPNYPNHLPMRHPRDDSPHPGSGPKPSGASGYAFGPSPSESPMAGRSAFPIDPLQAMPSGAGMFNIHGSPVEFPENFHGILHGPNLGRPSPKKAKKARSETVARRWNETARGLPPNSRPKGQHSAPRGGPPRSWTNADLTEALTMVWNKTMTTSQASRIFGIPYNSLLMYVRGKYGKSLKLETLRRNLSGEDSVVINHANNNGSLVNNVNSIVNSVVNNVNNVNQPPVEPIHMGGLPPQPAAAGAPDNAAEAGPSFAHHPMLGASLGQRFFQDFVNFPVPVNMVHLLPPSEQANGLQQAQSVDQHSHQQQQQQQQQEQPIRLSKSRSPTPAPEPAQSDSLPKLPNGTD